MLAERPEAVVTMDPWRVALVWRKSSYSTLNGCVEVAMVNNHVAVRSSRDPQGPILQFTADEWKAFLKGVRGGEFDMA
jgi:Domain of unknown function (DUF397)